MDPNDWTLNGNASVNADVDFLGTVDNQPLVIKTNSVEAMRVDPGFTVGSGDFTRFFGGNVGIGTRAGTILPQTKLHVVGDRIRLQNGDKILDMRADGGAVDLESSTHTIFIHSSSPTLDPQASNNVLLNPFPGEGSVGIGTTSPEAKLHVNGTARVNILEIEGGGDVAESFPVEASSFIEPGTVLVIDDRHPGMLKVSDCAYDRKVAGIVTGAGDLNPGLVLHVATKRSRQSLVALTGRVYCKVEATSNPIEPGDRLTTSAIPGHAMKAVDINASTGAVLGKAMTGLSEGSGCILVLVNLH